MTPGKLSDAPIHVPPNGDITFTRHYRAVETDNYESFASPNHQSNELVLADADDALPNDYERCGSCGFDHSYEYEEAHVWHLAHPEGTL